MRPIPNRVIRCAAAAALPLLLSNTASATLIWTGNASDGTGVFKLLDLEDANKVEQPNPSPNGSSITTTTDPNYGPEFQFFKAAPDLRAEAHGANGFDPASGNTYFIGWRFKVNTTVDDNAVFQWKAYGTPMEQDFPIVLSFASGNLHLMSYAPGIIGTQLWSQPETPNEWNSIVLEITVSQPDTTTGPGAGAISFWWNGTEENLDGQGYSYTASTFDGTSVDPKWGVYGAVGTQQTNVVSGLAIGTTYADVAPAIVNIPALTWNNAGAPAPNNGTTWDTTNNNWNNGSNATLYSQGADVTFNDSNNGKYNVTLSTAVTPDSVTFNNSSGNYVLSGSGAITGETPLTKNGTATLTIDTNNSYTFGTNINSGAVIANSSAALGAATGALFLGTPAPSTGSSTTATASLTLNASLTVGSFSSTTNNASADLLTINHGFTLTDNGSFIVGPINDNSSTVHNAAFTATGGGSLAITGQENFLIGQASTSAKDSTTADFSGLSSLNINTTATVGVGLGANSKAALALANTTVNSTAPVNFISAAEIDVGNTQGANDAGASTLTLGSGTNTLDAAAINIGFGKTGGSITGPSGATAAASVNIAGTGGAGAANITLGQANTATYGSGRLSQLLLAGHTASVTVATLTIGDSTGNTANGPSASVTFDSGNFTAQSVIIAADTGGTSTTGPAGALFIGDTGANPLTTGVFTVGSAASPGTFELGDFTNNVSATATPTLSISSGTLNLFANVAVINTSSAGIVNSSLTLANVGVLNMENNAIGTAASPVTSVLLAPNPTDSVTLENLGGAGINGAGLSLSGAGSLTLLGHATYTGGTTVSSGKLIVGANGALPNGPLAITGGTVQLAPGTGATNLTSLTIAPSGTLDLTNNHLFLTYTPGNDPIASIAALIKSGYNGGNWLGPGITSSSAQSNTLTYGIGYADSADPNNPAGLPSGTIEIKYTLLGDANLDGKVNGTDFAILATNFNQAVTSWDQGDFNYDGKDNGTDFAFLASNFNQGASQADLAALKAFAAAHGLTTNVPEPAAALLLLTTATLLSRRTRSRRTPSRRPSQKTL